jgi:glycosyltransferase involved in cell wall biosynthesis
MTTIRKIMLLTSELRRVGGVEAHVAALATGLRGNGYEVEVVTGRRSGDPSIDEQSSVVDDVGEWDVPPRAAEALETLVRHTRPDVVHSHAIFDNELLARIQHHAPVLRSVHNYHGCFSSGLKYFSPGHECHRAHGPLCVPNALVRNCGHRKIPQASLHHYQRTSRTLQNLREADGVLGYSRYLLRDLEVNRIPKLSFAPMFVPPASAAPPHPGNARVLYVGRLIPAKGVATLVRAVAAAGAYLDVHGEGRAEPGLRRLVARLGIEKRVVFHGLSDQETLERAYAAATVVAVPSIWPEPFGLVGLEAMTRARAVLASRTGGIPEWLADGETGRLVASGDVKAWAEGLRAMLADQDGCHALGRVGRERVLTDFTLEAHLASLLPAYTRARAHWEGTRA